MYVSLCVRLDHEHIFELYRMMVKPFTDRHGELVVNVKIPRGDQMEVH